MATLPPRRWQDFVEGVLSQDLDYDQTMIESTGLKKLKSVTSPEYVVLVLDPATIAGAQEVVYVTEHTLGESTATIERAKEGTSQRLHRKGEFWMHSLVASDVKRLNKVFVQDDAPDFGESSLPESYIWIQTGLGPSGEDFTLWFEDGEP